MQNFGDYLSPLIVSAVSQRTVEWSSAKAADMIAIGTVLPRLRKAKNILGAPRRVHVWGAGCGEELELLSSKHYYHCLRGPLTSRQVEGGGCSVYGDPGLLADQLVNRSKEKKYEVGIIAHYFDKDNPSLRKLTGQFASAKIIDVFSPVDVVLREISECSMVFSSSLHGLIVSDSYGVPNQWVQFDRRVEPYKFKEYFFSQEISMDPVVDDFDKLDIAYVDRIKSEYSREVLDRLKNSLVDSFPDL